MKDLEDGGEAAEGSDGEGGEVGCKVFDWKTKIGMRECRSHCAQSGPLGDLFCGFGSPLGLLSCPLFLHFRLKTAYKVFLLLSI